MDDICIGMNIEEQYQTFSNSNAWYGIFQLLNKNSNEIYRSNKTTVAKKINNSDLNRYIDVVPFDNSRIKLNKLDNDYIDNDYINASLVQVEKAERNYILTQGPLQTTVSHFWLMIWQQNSRAIIMLNKLIENGLDKCFLYWPVKDTKLKFDDTGLEVEPISEKASDNSDFVIREFKLKNLKENSERTIFQFHCLCWPDFDVPKSPESFVNFLFTVRQTGYLDSNKYGPAIVHCSAGIGRSGTFILVDSFLILLKKAETENKLQPNVLELLLNMRSHRLGLVQTQNQLRFAYEAIINAKNSKLFKEEINCEKDQQNSSTTPLLNDQLNKENELRKRVREEKTKKTMEHIKRIKDKQKEIDNWNRKQKQLIKYSGIIFGVTLFVGTLFYRSFLR